MSNETAELAQERAAGGLGTSLKPRHITMISIAGVIGAGLFVGSKNAIKEAGPAVLVSYFLACARRGERAPVRMWLFPSLTAVTIAGIVAILVLMAFDPDQQQAILLSAISAVFIVGTGVVVHRRRSHDRSVGEVG